MGPLVVGGVGAAVLVSEGACEGSAVGHADGNAVALVHSSLHESKLHSSTCPYASTALACKAKESARRCSVSLSATRPTPAPSPR